ncbi:MAG: hypothetical protein WC147_00275 [Syntrophomonas sp.]
MIKAQAATEKCLSCIHYGYCAIYWGADCKRQGGKKIPRMKSRPVGELEMASQIITTRPLNDMPAASTENNARPTANLREFDRQKADRGAVIFNKFYQMLEPIRTKAANW